MQQNFLYPRNVEAYIFIFVKDEKLSSDNYVGKNARIFQSRDLYMTLY